MPRRRASWVSTSISSSSGQHEQRPARQRLVVPRNDRAAHHQQPVRERVEQRPEAAVLARDPGRHAVEVVTPGDEGEQREREARAAVAELSPMARNTGTSARRAKPIAFGIVHGFRGWPRRVCGGGPPERSSPTSRRKVGEGPPQLRRRLRGASSGSDPLLAAPDLELDLAPRRSSCRSSPAAALRAARRRRTSGRRWRRRGRRRARRGRARAARRTGSRRASAPPPRLAERHDSSTSKGATERGHEMPCSSANCSIAAATVRAGPMP